MESSSDPESFILYKLVMKTLAVEGNVGVIDEFIETFFGPFLFDGGIELWSLRGSIIMSLIKNNNKQFIYIINFKNDIIGRAEIIL